MKGPRIKSYEFTRFAEEQLLTVGSNSKMIEQIRLGDRDTFEILFKNILDRNYSFFDFIKRYLCSKRNFDFDSLTQEKLMHYIRSSFFDNQMDNVGSLTGGTKLKQCLNNLEDKPVTAVKRSTIFLFFFGLGMDEKEASRMLTKEFLQADFNVRDPEEMIYFYCLKHHLKFPMIDEWRKIYQELDPKSGKYRDTLYLNGLFEPIRDSKSQCDESFKSYLTILKSQSVPDLNTDRREIHPISTRENVYRSNLSDLEAKLSPKRENLICSRDERRILCQRKIIDTPKKYQLKTKEIAACERLLIAVDYNYLYTQLKSISTDDIAIPETIRELIDKRILIIPEFTNHTIKKRIHDRSSHITRADLLTAIFYNFTYQCDDEAFQKRRSLFECLADSDLAQCGYHDLYLLNPFELFLTSCLFYEDPFKYFLAVQRYANKKPQNTKDKP